MKRLAKQEAPAFAVVFTAVNAIVLGSLYYLVSMGLDEWFLDSIDAVAGTNLSEQFIGERTASSDTFGDEQDLGRTGNRLAMTLVLYGITPAGVITFPAYFFGTRALSRWGPFKRIATSFGTKKPPVKI